MFPPRKLLICSFALCYVCACSSRIPFSKDWAFIFHPEKESLAILSACNLSEVRVFKDQEDFLDVDFKTSLKRLEINVDCWKQGKYTLVIRTCSGSFAYYQFTIIEDESLPSEVKLLEIPHPPGSLAGLGQR